VADLESGQRQRLLPDFLMEHYAISPDGQRVAFVVSDNTGHAPVWLASLNDPAAPRQITPDTTRAWKTYFVADGYVFFVADDNGTMFFHRVKEDGSELRKIVRIDSGATMFGASPDGKWVVIPYPDEKVQWPALVYPVTGGSGQPLCVCANGNDVERTPPPGVGWSPDAKFLYLRFQESMYAIPLPPGQMLPQIPISGFQSEQDVAALPGVRVIREGAFPGPDPSVYAFTKVATHRNIYRVPVP
jgi:hypothetical protein